jgi:NAD(P)-dependent dehydrogenase (short-subunit alcohol dehydrogenase family)
VVDRVLDALVVPSFTNVGFEVRRRLFGWNDDAAAAREGAALEGSVMVVTGATSGLGLVTATALARRRAKVLLLARNATKAAEAAASITAATGNPAVEVVLADMGDLGAVRRAAANLAGQTDRIDALIHNAGALLDRRQETADGLETTFAVHVAGPFLLTALLQPQLVAGSRVVWVSSGGQYTQALDLDDLQSTKGPWRGANVYARAKRAQIVLAMEWGARLAGRGVVVHAMHPGWADTPGVAGALPQFRRIVGPLLRTPAQGADTILWLATSEEAGRAEPGFWLDRRQRSTDKVPWTRVSAGDARRLWDEVVRLTGTGDVVPPPATG